MQQRSVDHRRTSRGRKAKRRHPRVKYYGFTAMQWPFIATLVGNWLFSAAVFAAGKTFWDWTPEAWGIADRLALVIKGAVIALIPGVVGICTVAKESYPDFTQFDSKDKHYDPKSDPDNPRWFMVDVKFVEKLPRALSLKELRQVPGLENMELLRKGSRLSVMPVDKNEFDIICNLAKEQA